VASAEWGLTLGGGDPPGLLAAALLVPAIYVGAGVVRLGMYTAYDIGSQHTEGVQTTLAATILGVTYLAGFESAALLVALTALFTYLMVTTIQYAELRASHALGMGVVQIGAIVAPTAFAHVFPRILLFMAVLYLIGPWFYRRYLVGDGTGV
jgi:CDP-diacylglycerol--serine O-phosphatidyltransferase